MHQNGSVKLACVLGTMTMIAISALAEDEINKGFTFQEGGKSEKVAAGKTPKNIDGISFDIAEKKDPRKIDWMKRAERGSRGNVTCYVDTNGVPTAVFVIGVAQVSKTLVAVTAERLACREAETYAKEAFALWMKEYVSVKSVLEHKTLVVRTNGEEASEEETKDGTVFTQITSAQWRGMSLFADALKDGRYVSIWRWSVKEQELAKMVEMLTKDESPDSVLGKKDRKVDWKVKERDFSFREDD